MYTYTYTHIYIDMSYACKAMVTWVHVTKMCIYIPYLLRDQDQDQHAILD